jgi:glycosyltransferase involved in cell wall biosynthesis
MHIMMSVTRGDHSFSSEQAALSARPPKVSVTLPTYNGTRYLEQSIQSILDQTLVDWQLIVVDDCSTEDVFGVVRGFSDPRIHYIRNGANLRLPRSLNTGLAIASGEYLTWTSDDNWYAETALEEMVQALETHPRWGLVCCDYYLVSFPDETTELVSVGPAAGLPLENCVGACFLYRRSVAEAVGQYNPDLELVEDYEYWLRVHNRFRIGFLHRPLYHYRRHGDSLTCQHGAQIQALSDTLGFRAVSLRRRCQARAYRYCLGKLQHGRITQHSRWLRRTAALAVYLLGGGRPA